MTVSLSIWLLRTTAQSRPHRPMTCHTVCAIASGSASYSGPLAIRLALHIPVGRSFRSWSHGSPAWSRPLQAWTESHTSEFGDAVVWQSARTLPQAVQISPCQRTHVRINNNRVLQWAKTCQNRGVIVPCWRSISQGVAHPPPSHVSMPSMYVVLCISAHDAEAVEEGLLCVFQFSITIVNRGHPIVLLSTRGCDAPV
ncbi:hypothetical protein C8Q76DRAFT_25508 [Earliella scabrosa]|nr:hypothetical protein C8Q76DRAFT_25508 [Earliella scabrosa]